MLMRMLLLLLLVVVLVLGLLGMEVLLLLLLLLLLSHWVSEGTDGVRKREREGLRVEVINLHRLQLHDACLLSVLHHLTLIKLFLQVEGLSLMSPQIYKVV